MKPTLLYATLSMIFASSSTFAKSEIETLRSLCAEQERQIRQLENENTQLRSGSHELHAPATKTELATTVTTKPDATATPATYTIKAGDSLEKIARQVGTDPQKLAQSNGLKANSIIHPGQKLKVPGASAPAASSAVVAEAVVCVPSPKTSQGTYKLKQGETFSSVARKHRMSTEALIAANPKLKPTALRPGQVISLGGSASSATVAATVAATPSAPAKAPAPQAKAPVPLEKAPTPVVKAPAAPQNTPVSTIAPVSTPPLGMAAATPETKPAPAAAKQAVAAKETLLPSPDKKYKPITIDGEMTYGEFASQHGTDAERLNALNGLDLTTATVLAKGSELYVPAQP